MEHSRFLFRPRHVVRTRSVVSRAAWVAGAIAALLALLALGHEVDSAAGAQKPATPLASCPPEVAQ